jgi:hypothetical protein
MMSIKQRLQIAMYGALLGGALLPYSPAAADDAQTDRLQRQIDAMQQQLIELKKQLKETKQTVQHVESTIPKGTPPGTPPGAPPGYANGTGPMPTKAPWPAPGVKVTFGGFLAAETAWRQRSEVATGASDLPFSQLPFSNSPLYRQNEWRATAAQSRFSVLATGDIDPVQHLQGYYEMDFLGAGVTANSRESNSYNLRIRQAFVAYDNDDWHFHFMAGQGWSLLTQDRVGITPRMENIPLTIDAQYVVGFNWARQEQARFVYDWNRVAWFGLSLESPQVNFASNSIGIVGGPVQGATAQGVTSATNVGGSPVPPGLAINDLNVCNASGLLNSTTACSNDIAPDIVEKFALDPGWGHYELVGLQRWFGDRVFVTGVPSAASNKVTMGWGVGGSVLVPVWPKLVDFQGSVLYGEGLGRYGSSQLADVTIGPDGSLQPLTTTQVLLGLVTHPAPGLDIYAYAGGEQVDANTWLIRGTPGGYGNALFVNNGCLTENQVGGPDNLNDPIAGTSCTANVHRTEEVTVGFWQNLYKGDMGRLTFGMQYEYVKLEAFSGLSTGAGTPNQGLNPYNQVVMTSIRYYPFQ